MSTTERKRYQAALGELFGDRPVAYHPSLAKRVGGVKSAVMLCQLLYWNGNERTTERGGWFYKSVSDMETETGLTKVEQQTARRELVELKLIEAKLIGIPRVWHYKVDTNRLIDLFIDQESQPSLDEKVIHIERESRPMLGEEIAQLNKESEITAEITNGEGEKPPSRVEEEPANSSFPEEDQSQQQTEHKGDYAQPDADEILGADIIARTQRYKDNAPPRQRLGKELDIYAADRRGDSAIEWFSESENYLLDVVSTLFSLSPPLGNRSRLADWKNGLRDIQEACGGSLEFTKQVLTEYHRQWFSDLHDPKREALTISRPGSLVEPCRAFAGRMRMASTGRDGPNGRFKTIDEFFAYIESLPQSEWHQTRLRMGFEFDPERRVYTPPWKTPVVDGVLEWFD